MYTLLYTVHIVHTVQCTHCTNQLMETSSAVLCTHSTAKLLSHVEAVSPPGLGLSHRRTPERTINRKPCNAVGEALKPSVASIPLLPGFPSLGRPREATPPRGGQCCLGGIPGKTANCSLNLSSYIDWLTNQRPPIALQTKPDNWTGQDIMTG